MPNLVLLADDDTDLSGILAQRLRADGYEVIQASDGLEALKQMEAQKPAIAFLDVHMPGLTGPEVCEKARQAPWGKTLPILILTSSREQATAARAAQAGATGYILKPPHYDEIRSEVRKHLGESEMDANRAPEAISPKLTNLIEKVNKLPAMPVVTQRLMEVLNNPGAGAKELAKVIALDPAVTAQVLRLANSAYYGQQGKVSDITKAVILVGFSEISHTLLALSLSNLFVAKGAPDILNRQAFWEHAVGCSAIALALAKRAGQPEPHRAQVAGLLHDLGKLVMACYLTKDYADILKRAAAERRHTREVEREVLGDNHSLVAEILAKRWSLPPEICRAIRYHHAPLAVENLDHDTVGLVRAVNAADALCKAAAIGSSGDDGVEEIPERVWQLMAIDPKAAADAVALARKTVQVQKAVMGRSQEEPPTAKPPVLLLLEGNPAVPLTVFALEAAGFSPRVTGTWSDGMQFLTDTADVRAVALESNVGPRESRLLDTVLRWRENRPSPAVLFIAPEKRLPKDIPAVPGVRLCPKPLNHAALRQALASA